MTLFNRRTLLRGATVAPALALAPVALADDELPELIELGKRVDPMIADMREAVARKADALARAEALWPDVPADLVLRGCDYYGLHSCAVNETDVDGKTVYPPEQKSLNSNIVRYWPRQILNSRRLEAAMDAGHLPSSRRTKLGRRVHALIQIASDYEAQCNAAICDSGLESVKDELSAIEGNIDTLCWRSLEMGMPRSMTGVAILARLQAAQAEVSKASSFGLRSMVGLHVARRVADALVQLLPGANAMAWRGFQ